MISSKKVFLGVALLAGLAMLVGSWAPFDFRRSTVDEVWQRFAGTIHDGFFSRSDVAVNVLMAVPFSFGLAAFFGSLRWTNRYRWRSAMVSFIGVGCLIGLMAFACEFGQGWLNGRVPSIYDWLAQMLGGLIGWLAWLVIGGHLSNYLGQFINSTSTMTRMDGLLSIVVIGILVWSLMPGVVITSLQELGRKWASGSIELVPFTRVEGPLAHSIYQWVTSVLLGFPLGLWGVRWLSRCLSRTPTFSESVLLAIIVGTVPEVLQILIAGRVASATDALWGVIGASIGIIAFRVFKSQTDASEPQNTRNRSLYRPGIWFLAAVVYAIVLGAIAWYPFDFMKSADEVRGAISNVLISPIHGSDGSDQLYLFTIGRLIVQSLPLGILIGLGVTCIAHSTVRRVVIFATAIFLVGVAVMFELGQLLERSHTGSGTEVLVRTIAHFTGMLIGIILLRRHSQADENDPTRGTSEQYRKDPAAEIPSIFLSHPAKEKHNRPLYAPGLDGLRAIACLAVFGVHWQQLTGVEGKSGPFDWKRLLENGNTGVAMFMLLTGFLLSLPIWSMPVEGRKRISLSVYSLRRCARILPAYFACLALAILVSRHWRTWPDLVDSGLHVAFLHNFSIRSLYSLSKPMWALAPIVQFYVCFGVFIWLLKMVGFLSNRWIAMVFLLTGILCQTVSTSLALAQTNTAWLSDWMGPNALLLNHSLLSHFSIFSLGVIAAYFHTHMLANAKWIADGFLVVAGVVLFLILSTSLDERLGFPGGRYNFPYVPILLAVSLVAVPRSRLGTQVLEVWPLRHLGVISYGFYLFHLPILQALSRALEMLGTDVRSFPAWFAIGGILVTSIASELFFRTVERPLSRSVHAKLSLSRMGSS